MLVWASDILNDIIEKEIEAMIEINLVDGRVMVRGSERFVEKNIEEMLRQIMGHRQEVEKINQVSEKCPAQLEDRTGLSLRRNDNSEKYVGAGIYSINENGSVRLHKRIQGKTTSDKMRNIGMIAAYAKGGKIDSQEVKKLCETQGCFDSGNFSSIFRKDIENIIVNKVTERKWEIELTVLGRHSVELSLDELSGITE